ncbi:MAG: protein-glutamate O-methyltransferase CheR [Calditrichaceae bacterium]|jgi:chemotaxis protein methyltransferase CheR
MDKIKLNEFLEAIYQKYGYDFRNYSQASLKRRIIMRQTMSRLLNLAEMQQKILNDRNFFNALLADLSINVTEMFRDPHFYRTLRETVIPILKTYPFIKIWHAGCSTGEEVYSMAILLKEEGLLSRSLIYATDFNEVVLNKAREGVYPIDRLKEYTINYQKAGGVESFSDYYTAKYDAAIMNHALKKQIVFAQHNLASDNVFGEMHMVMCRNVLIYFNKNLQNRSIGLFHDSLVRKGLLCLGIKESLRFTNYNDRFFELAREEKIYKKLD